MSFSRNIFGTSATSGALIVVTFLSGVLLARALGPDDRGVYGTLLFWALFAVGFGSFSIFDALTVRLRSTEYSEVRRYASTALLVAAVLAILCIVILTFLVQSNIINTGGVGLGFAIWFFASFVLIGHFNSSLTAVETAGLDFLRVNIERLITPILFAASIVFLVALGQATIWTLLIALVITRLPTALWRFWRYADTLTKPVSAGLIREAVTLGARFHIGRGALAIASQSDRLIVVSIWSPEQLGYYFIAFSVCGAGVSLASQALQLTLLPSMAGLTREERHDKFSRLFRLSLIVSALLILVVWCLAPFFVPLAYGSDYLPAAYYARGLIFAIALNIPLVIVNSTNQSLEQGRPTFDTALAIGVVMLLGWLLTDFKQPYYLFVTFAIAHILGIAVGLRHLFKSGTVNSLNDLVPQPSDICFLASVVAGWTNEIVTRCRRSA